MSDTFGIYLAVVSCIDEGVLFVFVNGTHDTTQLIRKANGDPKETKFCHHNQSLFFHCL
jgi:hypothetical protein